MQIPPGKGDQLVPEASGVVVVAACFFEKAYPHGKLYERFFYTRSGRVSSESSQIFLWECRNCIWIKGQTSAFGVAKMDWPRVHTVISPVCNIYGASLMTRSSSSYWDLFSPNSASESSKGSTRLYRIRGEVQRGEGMAISASAGSRSDRASVGDDRCKEGLGWGGPGEGQAGWVFSGGVLDRWHIQTPCGDSRPRRCCYCYRYYRQIQIPMLRTVLRYRSRTRLVKQNLTEGPVDSVVPATGLIWEGKAKNCGRFAVDRGSVAPVRLPEGNQCLPDPVPSIWYPKWKRR